MNHLQNQNSKKEKLFAIVLYEETFFHSVPFLPLLRRVYAFIAFQVNFPLK